jgi:hypothetical protein
LHECQTDKNMAYHLEELLQIGHAMRKKNDTGRCADES